MYSDCNAWQNMVNESQSFWESKLDSILRIDYSDPSDCRWSESRGKYCKQVHKRYRRILGAYLSIRKETQKMLHEKLNECASTLQILSHLVSFIPIFERFAKNIASRLTDGRNTTPNYNYQESEFYTLLYANELKPNDQERQFIFEQINKVIPFTHCRRNRASISHYWLAEKFTMAGYLVAVQEVSCKGTLLNKFNDLILLKENQLLSRFFEAERFSTHFKSIDEYVAFINASKVTNAMFVNEFDCVHYEILKLFKEICDHCDDDDWVELAGYWLCGRYESSST
eukprot:376783_1